jgi:hypothetical protein
MATSVLQSKIDLYGPDSEKLVDVLVFMAECYRSVAAYDEAEGFIQQVLEWCVKCSILCFICRMIVCLLI